MADTGALVLQPLSISAGVASGILKFEPLRSAGAVSTGPQGSATFQPLRITGEALNGGVGTGALVLRPFVLRGFPPPYGVLRLEALRVSGDSQPGRDATGALRLQTLVVSGAAAVNVPGTGQLVLAALRMNGAASGVIAGSGALRLQPLRAVGTTLSGGAATGALVLQALRALGAANGDTTGTGALVLQPLRMAGVSAAEILNAETFRAWVMNTRTKALAEYQNFPFNSLAVFQDRVFAAGDAGLVELTGNDDRGTDINAYFRLGFLDENTVEKKRLPEVLFALRAHGSLRLRVWTDDDTSYEYVIPYFGRDTLQQIRRKVGKGLTSRYFRIEVGNEDGAYFEIDSLELPFTRLTRRLG